MSDNYPNPKMIDMIRKVPQKLLIEMLNPARKKKERFEAICQHLKNNEFDVVFLSARSLVQTGLRILEKVSIRNRLLIFQL